MQLFINKKKRIFNIKKKIFIQHIVNFFDGIHKVFLIFLFYVIFFIPYININENFQFESYQHVFISFNNLKFKF